MSYGIFVGCAIVAALWLLIESGKCIVRSLGVLARRWRVSDFILSFILIAFATSLPELAVGLNAAWAGVPELSLGDILGTNIVNLTLIIGLIAVIGQQVSVSDYTHFKRNRLYQLLIVLAPLILLLDGTLSRIDGAILLGLFVWNLFRFLDIDNAASRPVLRPHLASAAAAGPDAAPAWRQSLILILAVGVLLTATYIIIDAAQFLAHAWGMPTVLIGILVIATCTSLPELTIGVRSALEKRGGVAIGDVFGAAAFNSTLTLGLVALVSPIIIDDIRIIQIGIIFTVLILGAVFYFLHTKQSISRSEGLVLLTLYGLFIAAQLALL